MLAWESWEIRLLYEALFYWTEFIMRGEEYSCLPAFNVLYQLAKLSSVLTWPIGNITPADLCNNNKVNAYFNT